MGLVVKPQYDQAKEKMQLKFNSDAATDENNKIMTRKEDIANDAMKVDGNRIANDKGTVELLAAKMELPTTFDWLYESDIWVCDTEAFSHYTNNDMGDMNV